MPFKHKLSKRLALMRDAAFGLAAAVIACSPDQSISGPPSLLLNSSQPVCQQSAAVWLNNALAAQTGSFTAQFDATPNGAAIAGVVGLSAGAAGAYTDLAPIVAFNLAGQINARDGGAYAAVNVIPYTAGTSYHFRLVVDLPSRTYSAYVTPFGGTEVTIGSGYAFRTEQSAVTALANWASYTSSGTVTLCNVSLGSETPSVSVASVTLLPASVGVGQTVQLTAALTDAAGSPLSGRVVTWASGAPAVATVSGSGLVAGVAAGPGTITATSEGQSGAAAITVTAPVSTNPSTVADLAVAGPTDSSVTLSFTEVDDGTGLPASYDVRYAVAPISWGVGAPAARGSCATPLTGTTTGTKRTWTVLGLPPGITY